MSTCCTGFIFTPLCHSGNDVYIRFSFPVPLLHSGLQCSNICIAVFEYVNICAYLLCKKNGSVLLTKAAVTIKQNYALF